MDEFEIVIQQLFTNDQRELRRICDKEITRFGGISQKDYDDFYSRAGYEISLAKDIYDPSKRVSFTEYISGVIRRSVRKEMTDRNRKKRCCIIEKEEKDKTGTMVRKRWYMPDISIDTPLGDESGLTIADTLQSDFNLEDAVIMRDEYEDERAEEYLRSLSNVQRRILEMKMEGLRASEIKQALAINDRQYKEHCRELMAFAKIQILFGHDYHTKEEEVEEDMSIATQTMENCKTDRISIASMIKKIDRHTIRFDHPLQRESDQWSPSMKGNLISDILQGNKLHPLIFAEQIINGVPIIWDLDGKQRCTNAYAFSKDGYKVSKNIRRWMIKYQTTEKDRHGNDVLDQDGFPSVVNAEYDIRGKKFSELPEELQDRFLDYSFNYDQYLNCSEGDIGYHIERYNDGRPMTSPQKGITKLGTEYAELVKSISNMPFFKDIGGYKVSEFKNGTIDRVVVESIMASFYLNKWNKLDYMCEYIKENSDTSVFDHFEDMVGRMERIVTDEAADLFDSKDSFLWFGLFARFVKTETDDRKFIRFMTEFTRSLHSRPIDGISFDHIVAKSKSTKDKGIVNKKINHLERLMREYLESAII